MKKSTRRLNFMIEEAICRDLEQLVPPGKRSHVANEALRKELERIRRRKALEKLNNSSSPIEKLSTLQIVEGLAHDRSSH